MIALEWAEEPILLNDRFQNWLLMSISVKKLDDYIDFSPDNYCPMPTPPPPPLLREVVNKAKAGRPGMIPLISIAD
jgi:hypothetical protein